MIFQQWVEDISSISHLFSVTISEQCVPSWCGILESEVYFRDTYVKCETARKCRRKLSHERVPSGQTIHNLVNKLGSAGLLIDKKQEHTHRVLRKSYMI
jgi:hypothetical protein